YLPILTRKITHFSGQLNEAANQDKVIVAGMVTNFRNYSTKDGKPMGFVTLEDVQGKIELVCFPRTWAQYGKLVDRDVVLSVEGKIDNANGDPKILVDRLKVETIEDMQNGLDRAAAEETAAVVRAAEQKRLVSPEFQKPPVILSVEPDFDEDMDEPPPEPPDWHLMPPPARADAPERSEKAVAEPESTYQAAPPVPAETRPPAIIQPEPKPVAAPPPSFVPLNYLVAPTIAPVTGKDSEQPRMATIILRSCEDRERDARRIRRICGVMRASPGKDRFSFLVFENGHRFLVEFPNDTTGLTTELIRTLINQVGEENVRVETIQFQ
ncbi:MAG: hypothetical protein HGA53_03175, partial [Anaerolineaceae bacterium]|nr:hypothetical protein [Anaerolineaceae bacterium]